MARFIKKQQHEIGLSPDELIFRGEQKTDEVLLSVIDFNKDEFQETSIKKVSEILAYKQKDSVTWFNIDGLHNIDIMKEIIDVFQIDQLLLADVMHTHGRPTVKEYDDCIFVSVKMLREDTESQTIKMENLSLILTPSTLISFQEQKGDVFDPVRERIRKQKKRIRSSGTDYLLFALLDIVIDNYIYIISLLGEKIERVEDKLLQNPKQQLIERINAYKKELNYLRKNVLPAKEVILSLSKLESDIIDDKTMVHFKELQDNIHQSCESSESYREILSDQLNIYHTNMSSRLNDIMKFLTVFSVIFIPLTFIAGIYGTNFDHIPELHYRYSYYIMWGVMLITAIGMLVYFKKKKWL